MFTIEGKYSDAKIFTDLCEDEAINQIKTLLDQPFAADAHARFMPDVHAGKGCTVGTTLHIKDKVCPNLVGVDIGCGVLVANLGKREVDLARLDAFLTEGKVIPSGMNRRAVKHPFQHARLTDLKCAAAVDLKGAALSLCSLGGGNHFIEVDRGEDGTNYLLVHTGSRHLGVEVCKYYQSLAISSLKKNDARAIINELKAAGRASEIQSTLLALKADPIPADLAYLEGENLNDYLHDMAIVQEYATWNRFAIATETMAHLGIATAEIFSSVHNYIDTEEMILRKGAISAAAGKKLVIPLSMTDGAIIGIGKGHPAWNYSAPHGAGRQMSRAKAKSSLSLDDFAASMSGIYTTSVCADTLDEAPAAYKPAASILENIKDTVEVLEIIKPIYNFKAH